jgi:hypothetical protein
MIINGKRALAYVVTIDEIKPIEGYDRVEYARTNGWWCIISKNDNIQVGDKCVYFEVDSKANAEDERFAFLEKRHYKIKTQKMCKVISQGLLMPLKLFPELGDAEVNTDVTDILKVTYAVDDDNIRKNKPNPDAKYNAMAARHKNIFKQKWARWLMRREWGRKLMFLIFGKKKDNPRGWPTHFPYIHKTDEERCENIPWVLKIEDPLVVTEKLDGTSCTYILERLKGKDKFEFYVLSRNIRQKDENQKTYHDHNIYWDLAFKYDIENELKAYLKQNPELTYVCIQGEGVGSVQGNPLKLDEDDLYVFNFIDSQRGRYPSVEGMELVRDMGLKWVPILCTNYYMPDNMEEFKQYADGKSAVNPKVKREGVVIRNPKDDFSFKNVSREYLLKHNQ